MRSRLGRLVALLALSGQLAVTGMTSLGVVLVHASPGQGPVACPHHADGSDAPCPMPNCPLKHRGQPAPTDEGTPRIGCPPMVDLNGLPGSDRPAVTPAPTASRPGEPRSAAIPDPVVVPLTTPLPVPSPPPQPGR